MTDKITIDEFKKLDLRVAEIKEIEEIPKKDKLLKLTIDIGNEMRTIVAGIKPYYSKEELKGRKIIVIANLEPAKLSGITSEGMLLAAVSEDEKQVVLLQPDKPIQAGAKIK